MEIGNSNIFNLKQLWMRLIFVQLYCFKLNKSQYNNYIFSPCERLCKQELQISNGNLSKLGKNQLFQLQVKLPKSPLSGLT